MFAILRLIGRDDIIHGPTPNSVCQLQHGLVVICSIRIYACKSVESRTACEDALSSMKGETHIGTFGRDFEDSQILGKWYDVFESYPVVRVSSKPRTSIMIEYSRHPAEPLMVSCSLSKSIDHESIVGRVRNVIFERKASQDLRYLPVTHIWPNSN